MQSKWLLAWQFGDNLGHMRGLCAIAHARAGDAGQSFIATPDLSKVPKGLQYGFPGGWIVGPNDPGVYPLSNQQLQRYGLDKGQWTYAQWLMQIGFADPGFLAWQLSGWCQLISAIAPERVVVNHSPLALIAACALEVKGVHVGTGFTCPPPNLPPFRTWEQPLPDAVHGLPAVINEHLQQALSQLGLPSIGIEEALSVPTALWSLPELDHYPTRSGHSALSYVGALSDSAGTAPQAWQVKSEARPLRRAVMYARQEHAGVKELIEALCQRQDIELRAYVPGVKVKLTPPNPNIVFAESPLNLEVLLQEADLFIGYGGASTAALALQMGVPMLLLPQHAEQFVTAHRLHQQGVAEWFRPDAAKIPFAVALEKILANSIAKQKALACAAQHADKPVGLAAKRLVDFISSV